MILVCGGLADVVTELVCARLLNCGYPYRFLDFANYPAGFQLKWHWAASGLEGYISGPGWKLDLSQLTGVFVRYLGEEGRAPIKDFGRSAVAALYHEYDSGVATLLEDLPCVVINRLRGGYSNSSKVYQALLVRQSGLLTPPTLVTNDPQAALRFYEECQGEVIYKSLSGVRSIVRRLQPDQLSRLPLLLHGPTQFQAFIDGVNVRVHTVGERVFATLIQSAAVDYRYGRLEGHEVRMEPDVLPPEIAESCLRLARRLDLVLTGIDLKRNADGEYFCFEVNPSPGFLYYEKHSGQPISLAVADLLRRGTEPPVAKRQLFGTDTSTEGRPIRSITGKRSI
jgi:hypothetical protein